MVRAFRCNCVNSKVYFYWLVCVAACCVLRAACCVAACCVLRAGACLRWQTRRPSPSGRKARRARARVRRLCTAVFPLSNHISCFMVEDRFTLGVCRTKLKQKKNVASVANRETFASTLGEQARRRARAAVTGTTTTVRSNLVSFRVAIFCRSTVHCVPIFGRFPVQRYPHTLRTRKRGTRNLSNF